MKNKRGKVVSKRSSAAGRKQFKNIQGLVRSTPRRRDNHHCIAWCDYSALRAMPLQN